MLPSDTYRCFISYCSKGKRVCQGQPCYTSASPTTTVRTTPAREVATASCRTGWSDWINTHTPKAGADPRDYEPIPRQLNPVSFLMIAHRSTYDLYMFL